MKIKPEHFEHLKTKINALLDKSPEFRAHVVGCYERGEFVRSERFKDLQTRFNFDLLQAAGLWGWVSDNVYPYANDTHIATALKAICPPVTRRY